MFHLLFSSFSALTGCPWSRARRQFSDRRNLGLHLSYFLPRKFCLEREIRSAAEVNGREHQCLVHRKDSVAVAADALFVADCLADCSSEHDTGVLDRVVAVYIKISVYRNGKVEKTVAGKAVEHMVKKADAGVDVALSRSIQI